MDDNRTPTLFTRALSRFADTVTLSNRNIDDAQMATLVEDLLKKPGKFSLDLSYNLLTTNAIESLIKISDKIKELNLSHNDLSSDPRLVELAKKIQGGLSLADNNIQTDETSDALQQLENVNLSGNPCYSISLDLS